MIRYIRIYPMWLIILDGNVTCHRQADIQAQMFKPGDFSLNFYSRNDSSRGLVGIFRWYTDFLAME
jgi:hypothetical protein